MKTNGATCLAFLGVIGLRRKKERTILQSVRMYDFKLEGGEWFKEGFRKLLSIE